MTKPTEQTPEQQRVEGEALAEYRRETDPAMQLFGEAFAEELTDADRDRLRDFLWLEFLRNADEAELRAVLPEKDVDEILAFRQGSSED